MASSLIDVDHAGAAVAGLAWSSLPGALSLDVLARISAHPAKQLDELFPWNWKTAVKAAAAA